MTSDSLILISGAFVSLLFSYIPGLNTWYAAKTSDVKRLIMLGVMAVVSAAVFGLSCAGLGGQVGVSIECNKDGIIGLVKTFILAIIANQGAYAVTVKTSEVKRLSE